MILLEPLPATRLLISLLIFAFSGTLFDDLLTKAQRDCQAANAALLAEQREGAPRPCRM